MQIQWYWLLFENDGFMRKIVELANCYEEAPMQDKFLANILLDIYCISVGLSVRIQQT